MSDPLSEWQDASRSIQTLRTALVMVGLVALASVGTVAYTLLRPSPVYFVPAGGPSAARPGHIPDSYARDVAVIGLERRYTFTPQTVGDAHEDFGKMLHPTMRTAYKAQTEREAAEVREFDVSVQTALAAAWVTARRGQSVSVTAEGERTVYVGGQKVRDEPIRADVTMSPWAEGGRVVGVVLTEVRIDPLLSASGLGKGRRR